MSDEDVIGRGTRKALKQWVKAKPGWAVSCKTQARLKRLGLIEWVGGPMPCGGYACGPILTDKGLRVLKGKAEVRTTSEE